MKNETIYFVQGDFTCPVNFIRQPMGSILGLGRIGFDNLSKIGYNLALKLIDN